MAQATRLWPRYGVGALAAVCAVVIAACGTGTPDTPQTGSSPGAAAKADGCRFSTDALQGVTGIAWDLHGPRQQDIPWLQAKVPTIACAYGSREDGRTEPRLVIRTDDVTGEHIATLRSEFDSDCANGTVRTSSRIKKASWCDRDGIVINAVVELPDRLIYVSVIAENELEDPKSLALEDILALIG